MDEHQAGLEGDGAVDQLALGADACDDLRDHVATGHLEPVRPEVAEGTGIEQIVPVSEPMAAAWSKAVAVAATVIVAGVGAGVAPHRGGGDKVPDLRDKAKPAAVVKDSGATSAPARVRPLGAATPRSGGKRAATIRSSGRSQATVRGGAKASQPRGTGAPRSSTPDNGGSRSSSPTRQAGVNPGAAASNPTQGGVTAPSTPAGETPRAPSLPAIDVPSLEPPVSVNEVGGQVTETVDQTVDQVEGAVNGVTGSLPNLGG
jgi:hypothetical protein